MRRDTLAIEQSEQQADDALVGGIESDRFRLVLSNFVTGVTVITAFDGEMVGMSANSFCSISLNPPLVGFFAASTSTTYPRISRAGSFCVNILSDEQVEVARLFSLRGVDRFAHVSWQASPVGAAIIERSLAWIDCTIEDEVEIGDHLLVVGRVQGCDARIDSQPLSFYRGRLGVEHEVATGD